MMDGLEKGVLETGGEDKEIVPKGGAVSVVWRFFSLQKVRREPDNNLLQVLWS